MVRDLACPPADTAFECTKRQEKEDLQKIEEDDDAHAMVRLAVCYLQNEREDDAVDLLEKAAIHGNPEAKNNLAILYANGQGLEQDVEMARQLYEESAEGGCRDAMHNLGIMHDTGRGLPAPDVEAAAYWFAMAADKGHIEATLAIGLMEMGGRGTALDVVAAAQRFQYLVEEQDEDTLPKAAFLLGMMHLKGEGVDKDLSKGLKLITESSDRGSPEAQAWTLEFGPLMENLALSLDADEV